MKPLFFLFLFFLVNNLWAQRQDSLRVSSLPKDTLSVPVDSLKAEASKSDYPNARKALFYSLIPGGGQVYNKRYWKIPLVYGAFAATGYAVVYNEQLYKKYKENYYARVNTLKSPNDYPTATTAALKSARDAANKNRQLAYVGVLAVYLLSAADAFVDAHLKSFDVSDDLTLQLKIPTPNNNNGLSSSYVGIGLCLQWK